MAEQRSIKRGHRPSLLKLPAGSSYQILQTCPRTMASPFLQAKAWANSAMLDKGPLPRKRGSGCGFVLAINRAYSRRSLAPQTCAHPGKKPCPGVNPVFEIAMGVELASVIVEAVCNFMADDRAHAAVVDGVIGLRIVKGRLHNA